MGREFARRESTRALTQARRGADEKQKVCDEVGETRQSRSYMAATKLGSATSAWAWRNSVMCAAMPVYVETT